MEVMERLILLLSIFFTSTIVIFSSLGERRLDVYLSLFILEYFITLSLHSPLKRRVRLYFNIISIALFLIFSLIVAARVIEILYGVWIWRLIGF